MLRRRCPFEARGALIHRHELISQLVQLGLKSQIHSAHSGGYSPFGFSQTCVYLGDPFTEAESCKRSNYDPDRYDKQVYHIGHSEGGRRRDSSDLFGEGVQSLIYVAELRFRRKPHVIS